MNFETYKTIRIYPSKNHKMNQLKISIYGFLYPLKYDKKLYTA